MADELKENEEVSTENGEGETMAIGDNTATEAIPTEQKESTTTTVERSDVLETVETVSRLYILLTNIEENTRFSLIIISLNSINSL